MKNQLSEFIYGGMDGIITVVISATIGSGIPNKYIPIIGSASLIGDGFSMGVSRGYNSLVESKDSCVRREKLMPFCLVLLFLFSHS